MVDDVGKLFREQAWVDRMANVSRATDGVIGLQMPVVVPCERGNAITLRQIQFIECVGELFRSPNTFPKSIAMPRVISRHRHDFPVAMVL